MIIQEIVTINNLKLKHTYSSNNKRIKQVETGIIYDDVYDTFKYKYTYIETDEDIETIPEDNVPQE